MNSSNLVLIGMPGAGKSTIGVLLAKALKMPFIDTDLILQNKEDRFLQDIIDTDGLESFLSKEESTILNLDLQRHIIATGGSVIFRTASINHLKRNGKIIYLELTYCEIENRINNITSRGIAKNKSQSLSDVYNERVPLYERYADMIINCSGKSMEIIVDEIKEKFIKSSV